MENAVLRNEINKVTEFLRNDDTLFHLKHRWEDEKDYEDFAEYKTIIEEKLSQFSSNIKITKGFQITLYYPNPYDEIDKKLYQNGFTKDNNFTMRNLKIIVKINKNNWKITGGTR